MECVDAKSLEKKTRRCTGTSKSTPWTYKGISCDYDEMNEITPTKMETICQLWSLSRGYGGVPAMAMRGTLEA